MRGLRKNIETYECSRLPSDQAAKDRIHLQPAVPDAVRNGCSVACANLVMRLALFTVPEFRHLLRVRSRLALGLFEEASQLVWRNAVPSLPGTIPIGAAAVSVIRFREETGTHSDRFS